MDIFYHLHEFIIQIRRQDICTCNNDEAIQHEYHRGFSKKNSSGPKTVGKIFTVAGTWAESGIIDMADLELEMVNI